MSFEQVRAGNGNLITMKAILSEIKGRKVNTKGNPFMSAKLQDASGESHSVTINTGKNQLPPDDALNKVCIWALSTYQDKQSGDTRYSGFFNGISPQQQAGQPAQTAQATPQFRPQPQYKTADGHDDKKVEGMVLHGVICSAIQSGQMECKTLNDVRSYLELIMGRIPLPGSIKEVKQQVEEYPDPQDNPVLATGEDIPF